MRKSLLDWVWEISWPEVNPRIWSSSKKEISWALPASLATSMKVLKSSFLWTQGGLLGNSKLLERVHTHGPEARGIAGRFKPYHGRVKDLDTAVCYYHYIFGQCRFHGKGVCFFINLKFISVHGESKPLTVECPYEFLRVKVKSSRMSWDYLAYQVCLHFGGTPDHRCY